MWPAWCCFTRGVLPVCSPESARPLNAVLLPGAISPRCLWRRAGSASLSVGCLSPAPLLLLVLAAIVAARFPFLKRRRFRVVVVAFVAAHLLVLQEGSRENPIPILSVESSRIVGVSFPDDATIRWMNVRCASPTHYSLHSWHCSAPYTALSPLCALLMPILTCLLRCLEHSVCCQPPPLFPCSNAFFYLCRSVDLLLICMYVCVRMYAGEGGRAGVRPLQLQLLCPEARLQGGGRRLGVPRREDGARQQVSVVDAIAAAAAAASCCFQLLSRRRAADAVAGRCCDSL